MERYGPFPNGIEVSVTIAAAPVFAAVVSSARAAHNRIVLMIGQRTKGEFRGHVVAIAFRQAEIGHRNDAGVRFSAEEDEKEKRNKKRKRME